MSLINQALRKAQRERAHNRMSEPAAATTAPVAAPSGMSPSLIIGLVVAVAVLLALVVSLSVMLLNKTHSPSTAQSHPADAQSVGGLSSPATATTEETTATTSEGERIAPIVAQSKSTSPLDRETTTTVAEKLSRASAATETQATNEPAAQAAAQANQEIIDWLTHARISEVKISADESRVIINGESYTAGEHVNLPLGLKVIIIEERRVLFIDGNGKKYLKRI